MVAISFFSALRCPGLIHQGGIFDSIAAPFVLPQVQIFPVNTPFERRAVLPLAALYIVRMLGLFMVLPVLSLYGENYVDATPALLGVALGAYGLSQAILQVPFGYLSDRFGRKPLIFIGLFVFLLGSLVAAMSASVWGLILGRFLQGCGAIAAVVMALVADVTAEENRTKAMALLGVSIGIAFAIAMVLGPVISSVWGLAGVFYATAALAAVGLLILSRLVFEPARLVTQGALDWRSVLRDKELWLLNVGVFVLHFVLMAGFLAIPQLLEAAGIARADHWQVYLPVMLLSFIAMVPFIIVGERRAWVKQIYLGAIALMLTAELLLGRAQAAVAVVTALFLFFMAFNLLEATLPSWVSKVAKPEVKGTATGAYSTWQFLGAFAGGTLGGVVMTRVGLSGVFAMCAALLLAWWLVALWHRQPARPQRIRISLGQASEPALQSLAALPGVRQVTLVAEEAVIYLQVDASRFDPNQLAAYDWAAV